MLFIFYSYWCAEQHWEGKWQEKLMENWEDRGKVGLHYIVNSNVIYRVITSFWKSSLCCINPTYLLCTSLTLIPLTRRHEGELYKTLLSDYETRQKELLQENAEFSNVLQQMKKDMVHILRSKKAKLRDVCRHDDSTQVYIYIHIYI